jgi:small GTP-binding protein
MAARAKVVFVGDSGVGKTSLIASFLRQSIDGLTPTVGAMATPVDVRLDHGVRAALNVWDTAGQEDYKSFIPMFVHAAVVAAVVFDLSNAASFAHLPGWLAFLGQHGPDLCQLVVVGNKADVSPRAVAEAAIEALRAEHGLPYFETSALTAEGVDLLFYGIAGFAGEEREAARPQVCQIEPRATGREREAACGC